MNMLTGKKVAVKPKWKRANRTIKRKKTRNANNASISKSGKPNVVKNVRMKSPKPKQRAVNCHRPAALSGTRPFPKKTSRRINKNNNDWTQPNDAR